MADNAEKLDIKIATQYDGAGAQAARTDVEATGTVVEKQASVFERLAKERAENDARMNAATTEETAAQAKLTIEQEKQLIVATRRAMIEAAIAGDQTELSKLRSELAVRQLTIQTLQTEQMAQEQINALLVEQDALIKEAAASVAAKAAAEEAEAAAAASGSSRVYGPRMRGMRILQNFGLDADMVATIGIGLFAGMEIKHLIDEQTESIKKQNEELERQTKDWHAQSASILEQINSARSVDEMAKARDEAAKQIEKLQEQKAGASDEEAQRIENQIRLMQALGSATFNLTDAARDRVTEEEKVKTAIQDQDKALKSQLESLKEQNRLEHETLAFEEKLAAAKLKAAIQDIEIAEKKGEISHEGAAARRAALERKNDEETFAKRQAQYVKDLENIQAQEKKALDADKARLAFIDTLKQKQAEALAQESAGKELADAQNQARNAAAEAKKKADRLASEAQNADAPQEIVSAADNAQKAAEVAQAKADALALKGKPDMAGLTSARNQADASVNAAQQDEDKRAAELEALQTSFAAQWGETVRKIFEAEKLHEVEATSRGKAGKEAAREGEARDALELAKKQREDDAAAKKAEKEREAQAKKDQPIVDESNALGARASSDLTAGLQGRANAKGQEIIKQLHDDPKNTGVMEQLVGVLNEVGSHLTSMNASQKADMDKVKAAIERLRQQINHEKGYNG